MNLCMHTTITTQIATKGFTKFGKRHDGEEIEGHFADVTPGEKIVLLGWTPNKHVHVSGGAWEVKPIVTHHREFRIGDTVEYDSYNLSYYGTIAAIGAKTVSVEHHGSVTRMDLASFDRRNHDLDLDAGFARNSDLMVTL